MDEAHHIIKGNLLYLKPADVVTIYKMPTQHLQISVLIKLPGAAAWPRGHILVKLIIANTIPLSQRWERAWAPAAGDANSSGWKGPGNFLQGTQAILMLVWGWEPVGQMTRRLWAYSSQTRRRGLACSWCQETLISLSCQAETSRLGQPSPWQPHIPQPKAASPVGGSGPRLITEVVGLGCSRKCWQCLPVRGLLCL